MTTVIKTETVNVSKTTPLQCKWCSESFSDKKNMRNHVKEVHRDHLYEYYNENMPAKAEPPTISPDEYWDERGAPENGKLWCTCGMQVRNPEEHRLTPIHKEQVKIHGSRELPRVQRLGIIKPRPVDEMEERIEKEGDVEYLKMNEEAFPNTSFRQFGSIVLEDEDIFYM